MMAPLPTYIPTGGEAVLADIAAVLDAVLILLSLLVMAWRDRPAVSKGGKK